MKYFLLMMVLLSGCSACETTEAPSKQEQPESYPSTCVQLGRPCTPGDVSDEVLDKTNAYLENFVTWRDEGLDLEQMYERVKANGELVYHDLDPVNRSIAYRFEGGLVSHYAEVRFDDVAHEHQVNEEERKRQQDIEQMMMQPSGQRLPWLANTSRFGQIDRKRARVLSPYRFEFTDDEAFDVAKMLRAHPNYQGINDVQLIVQSTLPESKDPRRIKRHLNQFKDLRKFDYVAISTHGSVHSFPKDKVVTKVVQTVTHNYTSEFRLTAFVLPKSVNCDILKELKDVVGLSCDLNTITTYDHHGRPKTHDRYVLSVGSSFMGTYNSMPFSQQTIHIAACSIFSRFEKKGGTFIAIENLATVFGYKDVVNTAPARNDVLTALGHMLAGYTPYAAALAPVSTGDKKYSDEMILMRARNRKFIHNGKAVPNPGVRIVETVKIVHWDDPRLRIKDDPILPLHEDENGARRLIKGFVEVDGLNAKLASGTRVCKPDTSGTRQAYQWPLFFTADLMTVVDGQADGSHVEDVKILKDQIKHVDGMTYRVPFEILLKAVPDKIIDNQRLVMRVQYPFEGGQYGDFCGGGWSTEEILNLRIDPEPFMPTLKGNVSGALSGAFNEDNTQVESRCTFPGVLKDNYVLQWTAEFENPQGQLESVDIVAQVSEGAHKPGVEQYGNGTHPELISLTTHVSFTPTGGEGNHLRSYSIPIDGQLSVRAFPRDLEPGWFSAKLKVRLKSDDPLNAPGEVELDFDVSRYFDTHPCK